MEYLLTQPEKDKYLLVCLAYNSVLNCLDRICRENLIINNEGELIVDQLLVTGNGENRFASCRFSYGCIDLQTIRPIEGNGRYRAVTSALLRDHLGDIRYSALTDNQLDLIKQGFII